MKRVQLTLDEDLVEQVDQMAEVLNTSRSSFTREALKKELERLEHEKELEQLHVQGYKNNPDTGEDLGAFIEAQSWLEE